MAYCKRWTPPAVAPSGNSVTEQMLADWKAIMNDIDSNLIDAGLTHTATAGQLDIDGVTTYPSINTYAGFKEYVWEGSVDVIIRLDMGVGTDGKYNATSSSDAMRILNTPYIKVTVTYDNGRDTNNSLNFICPNKITNVSTITLDVNITTVGDMTCVVNDGDFFAFMYQCNSRGKSSINSSNSSVTYGRYRGATLAFILQRFDDGLAVIHHNLNKTSVSTDYLNSTDSQTGSRVNFINRYLNEPINTDATALYRLGNSNTSQIDRDGNVLFQSVHCMDTAGNFRLLPNMVSYNTADIVTGTEVSLEFAGGTRNFICLGNGNTLGAGNHGTYSAFAIIFENDL